MEHGKYTAELGRTLRRRMESTGREDLQVFFDHGKDGESQRVVPYFENYGLSTSLAFVDLAVVNKNTKSVLVLCGSSLSREWLAVIRYIPFASWYLLRAVARAPEE